MLHNYRPYICLFLLILIYSCTDSSYQQGLQEAREDINNNIIRIKYLGDSTLEQDKRMKAFFKNNYGIDFIHTHGCGVAKQVVQNMRGYNTAMNEAIQERHGVSFSGIFKKYPASDQIWGINFPMKK